MHGVELPEFEYHSDEWFEARRRSLGASEVAAALGFSTFQSPYSLWAEKTGRISAQNRPETLAMRAGKLLEPVILDAFTDDTGLPVTHVGTAWRHPDIGWATATPDALAHEGGDSEPFGTVDAKTAFAPWHDRGEEPDGRYVPEQYQLQAHWQMFVTGLDHAWLALFAAGRRSFHTYPLERDERLIDVAVDAATQFWGYVERDEEPPVDAHEATKKALAQLHDPAEDVAVELSVEAADALAELRQVRMRIAPLEERKKYLEAVVKAELERHGAAVGLVAGAEAVTWKTFDRAGYTVKPTRTSRFVVKEMS